MTLSLHRQDGSATLFLVLMAGALLFATGLVVDGGRKLNALGEARDLADNAARAGAQAVAAPATRAGGAPQLNPTAAAAAAQAYLGSLGHSGRVSVNGDTVTVTVTITRPMKILPLGSYSATAAESATAIRGGAP